MDLNYPNNLFLYSNRSVLFYWICGHLNSVIVFLLLYHNSNKVKAAKERLSGIELQKSWVKDNINEDINALNIKYAEALNRIQVTDKSINRRK